ncbi:hypothetical protein MP228_001140 [Amoeboaphelidium protococcarum]|nr:hypothetical protein MP228_001140 [Amoeboaphelidium protococcarum]
MKGKRKNNRNSNNSKSEDKAQAVQLEKQSAAVAVEDKEKAIEQGPHHHGRTLSSHPSQASQQMSMSNLMNPSNSDNSDNDKNVQPTVARNTSPVMTNGSEDIVAEGARSIQPHQQLQQQNLRKGDDISPGSHQSGLEQQQQYNLSYFPSEQARTDSQPAGSVEGGYADTWRNETIQQSLAKSQNFGMSAGPSMFTNRPNNYGANDQVVRFDDRRDASGFYYPSHGTRYDVVDQGAMRHLRDAPSSQTMFTTGPDSNSKTTTNSDDIVHTTSDENRSGSAVDISGGSNDLEDSVSDDTVSADDQSETKRIYRLIVRQQPVRARVCGQGVSDRRPIDPPPILQLQIHDEDDRPLQSQPDDVNFIVAHASLLSDDGKQDVTVSNYDGHPMRMLMGTLVSSVYLLHDLDGSLGYFFIFPDLSIRIEGTYRLCFRVMNLAFSENKQAGGSRPVLTKVIAEPLKAYTAKRFPGMIESSALMRCFARQGVKLTIRKDSGRNTRRDDATDISSEDGDVGDDQQLDKVDLQKNAEKVIKN